VTITIESLDEGDVNVLVKYGIHFWDLTPYKDQMDYNPDAVRDLVVDIADNHYLRVAKYEGGIIGFIGILIHPFLFNEDYTQATEVFFYVHPAFRDKDIGDTLLRRAEEDMKRIGVDLMVVGDMTSSSDLDRAYRHRGFSLSERSYHKVL
jgi:GNAT superfamily N-acetyltransferase